LSEYGKEVNAAITAFEKRVGSTRAAYAEELPLACETAHQPLFLPTPGYYLKALLCEKLASEKKGQGVYGLIDNDLSLFASLRQTHLPALNKNGSTAIGFKISSTDEKKAFNFIPKPSKEEWENALEKISDSYEKDKTRELTEILWNAYNRGCNLAEVNAFSTARICRELLQTKTLFFLYSDLQETGAFGAACEKLADRNEEVVREYNSAISTTNSTMKRLSENETLFWCQCECGAKATIWKQKEGFVAACASCGKKAEFYDVKREAKKISPKAVARSLILPQVLGTTAYVSGAGAFSEDEGAYGVVAFKLAKALGWPMPETFVWRNKDYYSSRTRSAAFYAAKKLFPNISPKPLEATAFLATEVEKLAKKVEKYRTTLAEAKASQKRDEKTIQELKASIQAEQNKLTAATTAFELLKKNYSVVDLCSSIGWSKAKDDWTAALRKAPTVNREYFTEYSTQTLH